MAAPQPQSGDLRPVRNPVADDDASSKALSEALGSSFLLVRLLVFALGLGFLLSCVFTVNPNEVAIVLRFGKPVGEGLDQIRRQGLHWAFPYPVDEIVKIRVGESKSVRSTNCWYAISAADEAAGVAPMAMPSLSPGVDGHVLTSDGNILHVRATMRYRITDPIAHAFRFGSATNLLLSALDNAIHWAAVRTTADEALYKERPRFRESIQQRVLALAEEMKLGVALETLDVEVAAPLFVKDFFEQVLSAEQDRNKKINEAQGEYDRITREADGEARRIVSGGMVASNALVQSVTADARFFADQLPFYRDNPALFRRRLRVETVTRVLTNAQEKHFLPSAADELRVNLSREPEVPRNRDAGGPAQ
ncbi:MAG: protease modulator HflK [Verrucomicrobiota bacterium]